MVKANWTYYHAWIQLGAWEKHLKKVKSLHFTGSGVNLLFQNRLIRVYIYFSNLSILDSSGVDTKLQFNSFIHRIMDNYIIDNLDLHNLVYWK